MSGRVTSLSPKPPKDLPPAGVREVWYSKPPKGDSQTVTPASSRAVAH